MNTPNSRVIEHQRRTLDFMLDALGLHHVREEAHRDARLLELEQQLPGLARENHRLRLRVAELERELRPDDAQLDALELEVDRRAARDRDRRADDI